MGFSLFGSESHQQTDQTTLTQNAGFSEVQGPATSILGSGNTINQTDQGALKVAGDIASQSLHQVEVAGASSAQTVGQAVSAVSAAARGETENILMAGFKYAAIAVIGWGVAKVLAAKWGR